LFFILLLILTSSSKAQLDAVIAQITNSTRESFVTGISGDGRFVVIESTGNIATYNPRNEDGNREIFLFDYAQRQIFQITNTKSLLNDPTRPPSFDNIKVEIVNQRPVISNDGRWIAFSSNATCSYPGNPNANPPIPPIDPSATTNPGNFDPNTTSTSFPCNLPGPNNTVINNLVNDGNTEIWLYQIPSVPTVDLSSGDEVPFVDLSAGSFIRVTNTLPSHLPIPGTSTSPAVIADDNRDASINDNGDVIAFISNRDLVPCQTTPSPTCGNAFPDFDNPEVYVYVHSANNLTQITATPRGSILRPIYNVNPNISGNGLRVSFLSNTNNWIVGIAQE
jgi:Tol biopolymer transport system component